MINIYKCRRPYWSIMYVTLSIPVMIFFLFRTLDKPTLFIIISLKLNSVEILSALNKFVSDILSRRLKYIQFQVWRTPSTKIFINVCEYSLKVLGETILFHKQIGNPIAWVIIVHAKRNVWKCLPKVPSFICDH
jgi:hypothetical protein